MRNKSFCFLVLVLIISPAVFSQTTATRTLPTTYIPGGLISVKIDVAVTEAVAGVIVKEWLPQDWVVAETMLQSSYPVFTKVENDPDIQGYKVYSWVAFGQSIPDFSLIYKVWVPRTASGDYQFYGRILTMDNPQGDEIAGDSLLLGNIGDINNDGTVDVSDVILCLRMAIGLNQADPQKADMNKDGNVDISDVILILRISIGLL